MRGLSGSGSGNRNSYLNMNNTSINDNTGTGIYLSGHNWYYSGYYYHYLYFNMQGGAIENNGNDGILVGNYVPELIIHECSLLANGGKTVKVTTATAYDITNNWWGPPMVLLSATGWKPKTLVIFHFWTA